MPPAWQKSKSAYKPYLAHSFQVYPTRLSLLTTHNRTLASAVSVPQTQDLEPLPVSPDAGQKRRQCSVSEYGAKRRRISHEGDRSPDNHNNDNNTRQSPSQTTKPTGRKVVAAAEERKRGQRLFGGLLGALSQSSTTSAQKRRADIEQRQQAKLRLQDEQHSETKKRKKEELVDERRRQQKELERTSVCFTHKWCLVMTCLCVWLR